MKFFSVMALVLALGVGMSVGDAEAAKRIGGGKSVGMQRQASTPDKSPTATPGTPASAAAPAAPAAAAGTAAAAQPKRSWMGPLAGIAAGLGLAALASHFGFGDELASMLMIGLAVVAVLAVVGFVMRKRAAAQAGGQTQQTAFAGIGNGAPAARPYEVAMPAPSAASAGGSMIGANLADASTNSKIPADFDVAAFVRNAKVQFIRLQAANDAGNLDDIREFTTPEMFAEIQMDMGDRSGAAQATEVLQLDGEVIEVVEDAQRYTVSVRFSGSIREERGAAPEAFTEMWHLVKPRQGSGGWVLAGIQQA